MNEIASIVFCRRILIKSTKRILKHFVHFTLLLILPGNDAPLYEESIFE